MRDDDRYPEYPDDYSASYDDYGAKVAGDQTFQSVFHGIFDEAFQILVERQRKYGPENVRQLGVYGIFQRLASDKVERIRQSLNGKIVHGYAVFDDYDLGDFGDEEFEDALFDIANYAFIILALRRDVWGKPLSE